MLQRTYLFYEKNPKIASQHVFFFAPIHEAWLPQYQMIMGIRAVLNVAYSVGMVMYRL